MKEYIGKYHLIDTEHTPMLELMDSETILGCWNKLDPIKTGQVIIKDGGEIVAGHESMLEYILASPSVYLKDLQKEQHGINSRDQA